MPRARGQRLTAATGRTTAAQFANFLRFDKEGSAAAGGGWSSATSTDGRVYYYHKQTGEVTQ